MGINCRGILRLPYANQFRLLAGESGLGNEVQWLHYLEEPRYVEWLKGGELIIMAGVIVGNDAAKLSKLVEQLYEKQVAGIVISISEFIPEVPKALLPLCDWLGLPLFEVPAHVRIIDISQSICRAILQQKKHTDEVRDILQDLLYGKRLSERRLYRLQSMGFTEPQTLRVVCFQIEKYPKRKAGGTAPALHGTPFYEEEQEEQHLYEIFNLLQEHLQKQTKHFYAIVDHDAILWVAEIPPGSKLAPTLQSLLELLHKQFPEAQLRIGVSEEFSDIRMLARQSEHAQRALHLSRHQRTAARINFYDDMVVYQLFETVDSQNSLQKMAERILRGLMLPEHEELLKTLACYIKNDCNAKCTAGELYLHSNTMHYRLKKIEAMLNRNLGRSDDLFDVMLALKMVEYHLEKP